MGSIPIIRSTKGAVKKQHIKKPRFMKSESRCFFACIAEYCIRATIGRYPYLHWQLSLFRQGVYLDQYYEKPR